MISPTENLPLDGTNAVRDFNYARSLWRLFLMPPPSLLPDEWAETEPLRFNYSESLKGPCDFTGRNYLRRPIRDAANPAVRKQKKIFGRGNGKTLISEIKKCYKIKFQPGTRGLCVWPASGGEGSSTDYVNGRLAKTIEATKCLNDLIPSEGQKRFVINGKKVILNGSSYGFIGSNSGSKGVGNRLNDIDFDEIEKYKPRLKNEGSIINLAEGATKGVADFQIDYSSTPTIEEGLMWQAIQKSNLHLYFLPCPHCSTLAKQARGSGREALGNTSGPKPTAHRPTPKFSALNESQRADLVKAENFQGWFIILFSEEYAAGYPRKYIAQGTADADLNGKEIPAATVQFRFAEGENASAGSAHDAKAKDGTWNYERIMANARIECPHCKQAIRDWQPASEKEGGASVPASHEGKIVADRKVWMDANGAWVCVKPGEPGDIGYMINSLYSPVINKESTWGGYAMEFISALEEGGEAVRTYINAILAGVYTSQEHGSNRVELSSRALAQPDWIPLLTADFHKNHPYLWFVVRKWCAFKLLPPVAITDGKPDFIQDLEDPQNSDAREICLQLAGEKTSASLRLCGNNPAWFVIGEIARFNSNDPNTGRSPLIDFLIAQKITGQKLVKFFRETAESDTMEFRRQILLAMWKQTGGDEKQFRAARGGDSELIAAGYCDRSGEYAWDELTDIITEHKIGQGLKIPARAVFIDCGFADNKNRIVLQKVHESATQFDYYDPTVKTKDPFFYDTPANYRLTHGWNGWQAIRGKPTFQSQGSGLGHDLGKHVEDPYFGTPHGGTAVVDILEIPTALFWLRKDDLREKRTKQLYTISPNVSFYPKHYLPDGTRTEESPYRFEDYKDQSTQMIHDPKKNIVRPKYGVGGMQSKRHPDHPDDCETYQVAGATHLEFFEVAAPPASGGNKK